MTESQDNRQNLPSASAWPRYERCYGSFQLEQEAKRLGQLAHQDSQAARRGTRIHAYLAGELDEDGEPIVLDEDEQQTADFLQQRSQDQTTRVFADRPWLQLEEKRLWLVRDGKKLASGKFDRCIYSTDGELALIQDFKSGHAEPQEAEISSQMRVLAVLVGLALPSVKEIVTQVVTVFFGVSERRFLIEDLAEAYRDINKTLASIRDENAPLTPSPEACRFCPAKLICPALQDKRVGIARMELITLPDGPQASMILDDVAMIRSRCDEIVEYYEAKLLADPTYDLPGYAMVPGSVERDIQDWKTAKLRLGEYLDADQLELAASYGIGKIETALAKALKIPKAQAKERFNQILEGLIELKQKKASLKRTAGKPKLIEVNLP